MISWLPKLLSSLLFRSVQRCLQALPAWVLRFRPFGVYEIRLGQHKSDSSPVAMAETPYQVRWITSQEEARRLSELATAENIASWDGTTRRAVAVWKNDHLLGVTWIAAEWFAEDDLGLHYRLADDEVWLFASIVAPDVRRQGLYTQLLDFLKTELPQDGYGRILLGISLGNKPSHNAHFRQGAKQLGTIFAAKCLGFSACRVGGQVCRVSKKAWAWRQGVELIVERE